MVETHTRILGIAPYDGMRTAMEQAAQAYPNVELEVYTGDLEEGQAIVQRMAPNSYDCIISRGGTATLIRQVTDLPVVDIHISVYDVLRTMKLAENYTSLYAIVGFPSITEPAHTLCSLLNFDLDILTVRSAEEVRHTLERLKQGGYRMVVCDMVTHTIAREMGFDAFLRHRKPAQRHRSGGEHQHMVRPAAAGEPVSAQHHAGAGRPRGGDGAGRQPVL